jgi:maleate isomerase
MVGIIDDDFKYEGEWGNPIGPRTPSRDGDGTPPSRAQDAVASPRAQASPRDQDAEAFPWVQVYPRKVFPGVILHMVKMGYSVKVDDEVICEGTFTQALKDGRIRRAEASLASLHGPGRPNAIVGVACTSMSFILGMEVIRKELTLGFPSVRTMDMAEVQAETIKALGASRIALLTPHTEDVSRANVAMLVKSAGVEVVSHFTMNLNKDEQTTAVEPAEIERLVMSINCDAVQVVVIGCSAFRACQPGFINDLERRLGKPVVTSVQAYLWWMLRMAGKTDQVGGYGRLFSHC